MKLYMVSELSISCLLFTLISPPPPMVNVRAVRILLECILVLHDHLPSIYGPNNIPIQSLFNEHDIQAGIKLITSLRPIGVKKEYTLHRYSR